ncbi:hypothetical protein LY76DRAFT_51431 [Colletotrichum caudatum]|nr:hypothetical protein LY76DRAFT_51431 [Colletotrichum caudatum]
MQWVGAVTEGKAARNTARGLPRDRVAPFRRQEVRCGSNMMDAVGRGGYVCSVPVIFQWRRGNGLACYGVLELADMVLMALVWVGSRTRVSGTGVAVGRDDGARGMVFFFWFRGALKTQKAQLSPVSVESETRFGQRHVETATSGEAVWCFWGEGGRGDDQQVPRQSHTTCFLFFCVE